MFYLWWIHKQAQFTTHYWWWLHKQAQHITLTPCYFEAHIRLNEAMIVQAHTHTHTHTHTQEIHKCVQRLLLEGRFCIPLVWINYISRHGPASHPWLHSMVMSTLHISAVQYKIPSIVRPRLNLKETSIYIYITDI